MSTLRHKQNAYDTSLKPNVIQFTHMCGNNCKPDAEFGISEKLVQGWCKFANELSEIAHTKKASRSIKPSFHKEVELHSWLIGI